MLIEILIADDGGSAVLTSVVRESVRFVVVERPKPIGSPTVPAPRAAVIDSDGVADTFCPGTESAVIACTVCRSFAIAEAYDRRT